MRMINDNAMSVSNVADDTREEILALSKASTAMTEKYKKVLSKEFFVMEKKNAKDAQLGLKQYTQELKGQVKNVGNAAKKLTAELNKQAKMQIFKPLKLLSTLTQGYEDKT